MKLTIGIILTNSEKVLPIYSSFYGKALVRGNIFYKKVLVVTNIFVILQAKSRKMLWKHYL